MALIVHRQLCVSKKRDLSLVKRGVADELVCLHAAREVFGVDVK